MLFRSASDKLKSEIMKSLKKNIASYKWPKILDFTKELPKTISGKIRRKEIRDMDEGSEGKEENGKENEVENDIESNE